MGRLRLSIADLMVVVVLVGLDSLALRYFTELGVLVGPFWELVLFGAGPMLNLLAVAFLIAIRGNGEHRFWVGFLVAGAAALALFIVAAWRNTAFLHQGTAEFVLSWCRLGTPYAQVAILAVLLLPQLVLAALGGLLASAFRVTIRIERRS